MLFLFDTRLGRCGLAWGEAGLRSVSFAHDSDDATRAALRRRAPDAVETDAPPVMVVQVIDDIASLFQGASRDFSQAVLDMSGVGEFERRIYALSRKIQPGEVKTYGDLARALGDISLSRRVGQALGRNPFPIIVPCHRIVGADGAMTGFSAPGGAELKRKLLKIEGALEPELFD
ncbi:MAG: methylated-DNA--[protein]-cysteine S-methyltransferase [Pseudomonadota bacterium]